MCSTLFYCVLHADCAMICPGTVAEVLIHSPMYQLSFFPLQCVSYSVTHATSCCITANYSSSALYSGVSPIYTLSVAFPPVPCCEIYF